MLRLKHAAIPGVPGLQTLSALAELHRAGLLSPENHDLFDGGYRLLRTIEGRLRLISATARDKLPENHVELAKLAHLSATQASNRSWPTTRTPPNKSAAASRSSLGSGARVAVIGFLGGVARPERAWWASWRFTTPFQWAAPPKRQCDGGSRAGGLYSRITPLSLPAAGGRRSWDIIELIARSCSAAASPIRSMEARRSGEGKPVVELGPVNRPFFRRRRRPKLLGHAGQAAEQLEGCSAVGRDIGTAAEVPAFPRRLFSRRRSVAQAASERESGQKTHQRHPGPPSPPTRRGQRRHARMIQISGWTGRYSWATGGGRPGPRTRATAGPSSGRSGRDIVGPAAQARQVDQRLGGLRGGRQPQHHADLLVVTWFESPSLQNRKVSPGWTGNGPSKSTCTARAGPSDRVMMFLEI